MLMKMILTPDCVVHSVVQRPNRQVRYKQIQVGCAYARICPRHRLLCPGSAPQRDHMSACITLRRIARFLIESNLPATCNRRPCVAIVYMHSRPRPLDPVYLRGTAPMQL